MILTAVTNMAMVDVVDALEYMWSHVPFLLIGARVSLELAAVGIALGLVLGLVLALLRTYSSGILRVMAEVYITVFRGTPLLLQLFVIYYGMPDLGLTISGRASIYIALGLNSAAYQAEYFRGALQAVDRGQIQAARSLGLSRWSAIRLVVIPQAARIALPAWSNEVVYMVMNSAIAFTIAVPELLARSKMLISWHYRPIEVFILVSVIYVVMLGIVSRGLDYVESWIRIPGLLLESKR
ncbi:MAG: amino acid ABC transporter permease [Bacillota bacterium]